VKVIFPDTNKPETFYLNPDTVDSTWFIFIPTHPNNREVVYLMSVVFFKDNVPEFNNTIRIEPRYYDEDIFSEFLSNTELKEVYNLLLRLIEYAEDYSEIKEQLKNLQKQNFIYCEIKTSTDLDNPFEINDYSKCVLFSYEPRTLVDVQESVIEKLIDKMQEILPPDYEVESE